MIIPALFPRFHLSHRILWGVSATFILLFFLIRQIRFQDLEFIFASLRGGHLLSIASLYLVSYLARSMRFTMFMRPQTMAFGQMFWITSIHNFLNHVLPIRSGELSYPYLSKRFLGVGYTDSISGLFVVRLFDAIFTLAFFVTSAFFQVNLVGPSPFPTLVFVSCAMVLLVLLTLNLGPLLGSIRGLFSSILIKLGMGASRFSVQILSKTDKFAEALTAIRSGTLFIKLALLTMIICLSTFYMFFIFMKALVPTLGFISVVYASVFSMVASLIPLNSFGSVGTMEAGWSAGFIFVGVPAEMAIASGFAMHFIVLIQAFVFAFLGWLMLNRSLSS